MFKTKPIPASLKPTREGDHIMITVPNHWGRGVNLPEAKKKVREVSGRNPASGPWRVYSVDPSAHMNEYGQIVHKTDHAPVMLAEHNPA